MSLVMDFMEKVLHSYAITTNMILAVILGTVTAASGLAMVFAVNASTGGTDILAKILNKYSTFNIGKSLLMVDLFVVICGGLTFGLGKGMFSLIAVVINGFLVDYLIGKIEKKREKTEKEEYELKKVIS
jgi:uncharacterized membrane-anchored protein YitT (DUF2179 family)